MTVDKEDADDVTKEFGDRSERYLSYALSYAEKGNFSVSAANQSISNVKKLTQAEAEKLTDEIGKTTLKGMVNDKPLRRK